MSAKKEVLSLDNYVRMPCTGTTRLADSSYGRRRRFRESRLYAARLDQSAAVGG